MRIWGSTNITQIERVQKIQNFAAKVALGIAAKSDLLKGTEVVESKSPL